MKYFLLSCDPCYTDTPCIINWHDKIHLRDIQIGRSQHIPKRQILNIQPNVHLTFPDIISSPFLLLSPLCMKVVKVYEPNIISKQIILLDSENKQKCTYALPILQHIPYLSPRSKYNLDKSVLYEGILQATKIVDISIFQIAGLNSTYTVIRLDLLESILKRGAKGLYILPLKIEEDNDEPG